VSYPVRIAPLLLVLQLVAAGPAGAQPTAAAQGVRLTTLVDAAGAPIDAGLVALVGPDGSVGGEQLWTGVPTVLAAPAAGSYRLRVRQVGRNSWLGQGVDVPAGRVLPFAGRVEAAPVALASLGRVDGCVRTPAAGTPVARAWEEAEKGLRTAWLARQGGLAPLLVRRTQRRLDLGGRELRSTVGGWTIEWERPLSTRSPAALSRDGWIVVQPDSSVRLDAPDEAALLSREFALEHCLGLVAGTGDRASQVGITFAPTPDRTRTDIAGTIWLDAGSGALREVEFRFRNMGAPRVSDLPGRVQYAVREDGLPHVAGWRVRVPAVSATPGGTAGVVGFDEEVAEALPATAGDALARGAAVGTVEGLVYDSLGGGPLPGATVTLEGSARRVATDGAGWFTLDLLPRGTHALRIAHPRLDSLAQPLGLRIRTDSGTAAQLVVATPSVATLRRRTCPDTLGRDRDVLLLGRVRDAGTGEPIGKAGALIKWYEMGKNARGFFDVKPREAAAFTEEDGTFRGCLPSGVAFSIAGVAETMSGELEYPGAVGPVVGVELWVDRDSTASLRGTLAGVVRDSAGRGVANATVALDGVREVARTDSSGTFVLRGLPVGSRMLDVRRLGYAAARQPVVVRTAASDPVTVTVIPARLLATRRITGQRALSAKLQGFEERRRQGFGTFFDANQLEFYRNTTTTAVVRRVPNITVMRVPLDARVTDADIAPGSDVITMPSAGQGLCYANIFIDGRPASQAEFWAYRPDDFIALEVYPRATSVPAAFGNLRNGCGAVAAWTK
jgi:hypothetical protein